MWKGDIDDLSSESTKCLDRFSDSLLDSLFDPFDEVLPRDTDSDSLEIFFLPDTRVDLCICLKRCRVMWIVSCRRLIERTRISDGTSEVSRTVKGRSHRHHSIATISPIAWLKPYDPTYTRWLSDTPPCICSKCCWNQSCSYCHG